MCGARESKPGSLACELLHGGRQQLSNSQACHFVPGHRSTAPYRHSYLPIYGQRVLGGSWLHRRRRLRGDVSELLESVVSPPWKLPRGACIVDRHMLCVIPHCVTP